MNVQFGELNESVDAFAQNIADEIASIRFYEIDRVKAIAKTRLAFALQDLLAISITDLEHQQRKMVDELKDPRTSGQRMASINRQLSALKLKKKQYNRAQSAFEGYNSYNKLRQFLKKENMQHVLDAFYKTNPLPQNVDND